MSVFYTKSIALIGGVVTFAATVLSPIAPGSIESAYSPGKQIAQASVELGETASVQGEERKWYGVAPPEVEALGLKLNELAEEAPEIFGGVALAYDSQSVKLFVKDAEFGTKVPDVAQLISDNSELVTVEYVNYSTTELNSLRDQSMDSLRGKGISSAAVDVMTNQVVLTVEPGTAADSLAQASVRELTEGNETPLRVEGSGEFECSAGRYDDFPRFYMGGSIVNESERHCTTGIPVIVRGRQGLLTAGHCRGSNFKTPSGRWVGSMYTTAFPGNANKYGDWKILTGSTYGPYVFSGPANSSSTRSYRITGLTKRPAGYEVCHSGQTTGEICRYRVERTDIKFFDNAVESNHISGLYHDANRDGYSDCNGWQRGDSGGPMYSGTGTSGQVNVHGIVTGRGKNHMGKCRFYYTQFDGVTDWDSSVRVNFGR